MVKGSFPRRRAICRAIGVCLIAVAATGRLVARDVFVIISGGVSPFQNNYSQYLQAKAVSSYFRQHYPTNSVWTFFGAGNLTGQKPVLCDVFREVRKANGSLPYWEPGELPQNLPARADVILKKFREEILPAVADGGTLFLFVGDHGSLSGGRNSESIINLWGMERNDNSNHGWKMDEKEALSVSDLRKAVVAGIGKGKIVFCMTQCHSGGFHYLGMPREMTPNRAWFTEEPAEAEPAQQPDFPPAAGFTSTDEASVAAGCEPDPDPANWSGYERFFPENLFGMNLFTLKTEHRPKPSFDAAHVAATLADFTIDKPRSTSEQYLEGWADLLDGRLSKETNLTYKVRKALANYRRAVDGATPKGSGAGFREAARQYRAFTDKLVEQSPGSKRLLLAGTRRELENAFKPNREETAAAPRARGTNQPSAGRNRGGNARGGDSRRLWRDTIRPAWQEAVEDGPVANLPADARDFELHLLELEDEGENFFSPNPRQIIHEMYWEAGYGDPDKLVPRKAAAFALWSLTRRNQILAWAKKSDDDDVRAAAQRLTQSGQRGSSLANVAGPVRNPMHLVNREIASERVLFYRRVLAAWAFLIAVDERPALDRLSQLIELERTPLP